MRILANFMLVVGSVCALSAYSAGQSAAAVEDLSVSKGKDEVRVEVTVSSPVTPRLVVTSQPNRLLLQLPGTVPGTNHPLINVSGNGVESVRLVVDNSGASSTTVVVALDQEHPYGLSTEGNKIILTVLPPASRGRKNKRKGSPVPGAVQSVFGRIHGRRQETMQDLSATPAPEPVTPPHALPPLEFPADQQATTAAASSPADQPGTTAAASSPADQPATTAAASSPAPPANNRVATAAAPPPATTPKLNSTIQAPVRNQPNVGVRMVFQFHYVSDGIGY